MSRVTQFVDYINGKTEPIPLDKLAIYTSIAFTENIRVARRKYREAIKENEKTQEENKSNERGK